MPAPVLAHRWAEPGPWLLGLGSPEVDVSFCWWAKLGPGGPEAGAYPLVGEAVPRATAGTLVCLSESWTLWWTWPGPGAAVGSGSLRTGGGPVGGLGLSPASSLA